MTESLDGQWAVILGGSSGIGLATAKKLAAEGMHVCVVHRDRRGSLDRITAEFDRIRAHGHGFVSVNADALCDAGRATVIDALNAHRRPGEGVRLLLHAIAYGNLKPVTVARAGAGQAGGACEAPTDAAALDDEDMARTIYAMGSSLLTWVQRLHVSGMFAPDARVIGLTSEGNQLAWPGYAAVAAAKCALESVSRAIAVELGPFGVRSNVIQAGVTDTPSLRLIPGSAAMADHARRRNPLGRLTTPDDVAGVVYLLCLDDARWVNGALIRVDGGEHVAWA